MNLFQFVLLGISFLSIYSASFHMLTYILYRKEAYEKDIRVRNFKPTVSIVIPAYNEEKNIERNIKSALNQTYPVEVYVVDDASTDRTREICEKYAKEGKIHYFRMEKNRGKVPNVNFVLKNHIKTDLFCVLDADCFYEKDTVEKMIPHFSNKNVAAVIPTVKIFNPRNWIERIQSVEYFLASFLRPLVGLYSGIHTTNGLTMFRTEAVRKVGYFDERDLTEDMDMCMRLVGKGYKVVSEPRAHAYTLPVSTLRAFIKQRRRWNTGLVDNFFEHICVVKRVPGMKYITFPLVFAWVGIITGLFARMAYNIPKSLIDFLETLSAINYDLVFYIKEIILPNPTFVRFNMVTTTMLLSSAIFLSLLSYSITRLEKRERFKKVINTPLYGLTYSILLTLAWLATYVFMIKNGRVRKGWTHQT